MSGGCGHVGSYGNTLSRAKLYNRKRFSEKIEMKKKIKMHEQKETKNKKEDVVPKGAVPAYLLDR